MYLVLTMYIPLYEYRFEQQQISTSTLSNHVANSPPPFLPLPPLLPRVLPFPIVDICFFCFSFAFFSAFLYVVILSAHAEQIYINSHIVKQSTTTQKHTQILIQIHIRIISFIIWTLHLLTTCINTSVSFFPLRYAYYYRDSS